MVEPLKKNQEPSSCSSAQALGILLVAFFVLGAGKAKCPLPCLDQLKALL